MEPLGVHHVSINVEDVDRSTRFYTDVLGGSRRGDRPDLGLEGAWLDLGSTQVHLIAAATPPNLGQHFAIRVENLDAVVAELRDRGITVGDPSAIGSGRQAFLEDPDGNGVELHEVGTVAPRD